MVTSPRLPIGPRRWEWAVLGLFVLVVVAFGVIVEVRAVFLDTSKTDFGVYARAAWALRTGQDPYEIIDNNGWHYCYPLPFAILLTPLADPYPWAVRDGYLPFAVSVGLWYLLETIAIAISAHLFANAILPREIAGSRRWWYARFVPVILALGGLAYSLARGQANVIVVLCIAAMFASSMRGRRLASGGWLAAAALVKVIPAYLVLWPIMRRDARSLLGASVAAALLLFLLPLPWMSPERTMHLDLKIVELVLRPGAVGDGDQTRAKELTDTTSTDSQSFAAVIHAWRYPDRENRPAMASRETKLAHWILGAILTILTIAFGSSRARGEPAEVLVILGCLCVVMLLVSPVSHMHYYALAYPLVAGLWLKGLANRPEAFTPDRWTLFVLIAWSVLTSVPLLPGSLCEALREGGLGTLATLALWAYAIWPRR